jgi:hypothetical protein
VGRREGTGNWTLFVGLFVGNTETGNREGMWVNGGLVGNWVGIVVSVVLSPSSVGPCEGNKVDFGERVGRDILGDPEGALVRWAARVPKTWHRNSGLYVKGHVLRHPVRSSHLQLDLVITASQASWERKSGHSVKEGLAGMH